MSNLEIDLSPLVRAIDRMSGELDSQISAVRGEVSDLSDMQKTTYRDLMELRRRFEEFLDRNERNQNVQLAETRLGSLKAELDREFGHYAVVRRSAVGTLQAFDVGNVRNETVLTVGEELMIQTPRYWLAPALVALAAWSKDDPDLARKSVDAAFGRDPKKTSLFFALVLRRQGRLVEATRWLHHYFVSLDPRALTREFAVLLEAISQDGFGPAGRSLVTEKLREWGEELRNEADSVQRQVGIWLDEITMLQGFVDASLYPELARRCPEWGLVRDGLECASAHQFVIDKYSTVREGGIGRIANSLADRLDDLLEVLVSEYDPEELPLRREMVSQQALIDSDGDTQRARSASDIGVSALDETIDALSLQTFTALRPDLFGLSVNTQRTAVAACARDFTAAVGQFALAYRSAWPDEVSIVLDDTHSNYAQAYSFGTWSTKSSVPQDDAEADLSRHWDRVFDGYIKSQTFRLSMLTPHLIGGIVAFLLGLFFRPGGLILSAGAVAIVALVILQKRKQCESAIAAAEAALTSAKEMSAATYRETLAEWVDARIVYGEEDAKEEDLLRLIEGWPK